MNGLDTRPVESTAALTGTLAVVVALAIGLGIGTPVPVATSVLGGLALAGGAWALDQETNARIAAGSVALLAGSLCLGATLFLGRGSYALPVYVGLAVAVAVVATDATTGLVENESLGTALRESGNALLIGIVLAVLLNLNAEFGVLVAFFGTLLAVSVATPLGAFVTLQLAVLGVLGLLTRVVPVLSGWLPDTGTDGPLDTLDDVAVSPRRLPRAVVAVLALEVLVALSPVGRSLFALFLDSVPVVGPLLELALSWPLHVLVGLVGVALCCVLLADALQVWVVDWLGDDPARTLALQAGGLLTVAVTLVGTTVASVFGVTLLSADTTGVASLVGPAGIVLGGTVSLLLLVGIVLQTPSLLSAYGLVPASTAGFATGSALLFVTTLAAAELGLATPLVVLGVAGAILVWDVGAHAKGIGVHLGRAADSTDSQFVHVTGSALVLTGGVAVALAARYLLVPMLAPAADPTAALRSAVALGLVVIAVLAFAAAIMAREGRPTAE
ncbi:hypothetical protein NDI85_04615 [Halomicroarcula sp. S1AR25-4]|uniref:DUF7519 family protein n=1 Tax=Haloarcula sp. S1AR25-4 TaxID=2950538 RepID=UPI0028745FDB|nr:hypothetical protein [Halomicroarcula sp. S1AR25-4]MDS0277063.1 hypothetical protein [Halomicroarcula sp. S1AR25-4]